MEELSPLRGHLFRYIIYTKHLSNLLQHHCNLIDNQICKRSQKVNEMILITL
jgi:hypothetical protein